MVVITTLVLGTALAISGASALIWGVAPIIDDLTGGGGDRVQVAQAVAEISKNPNYTPEQAQQLINTSDKLFGMDDATWKNMLMFAGIALLGIGAVFFMGYLND